MPTQVRTSGARKFFGPGGTLSKWHPTYEYRAGQVSFTTVTTTEMTQLSNEEAALTVRQNRFLASVNLIEALGGGWDALLLPDYEDLRHRRSCVDVVGAIRGNIAPELPPCL